MGNESERCYNVKRKKSNEKRENVVYDCVNQDYAKKHCHYLKTFDKTCMHPMIDSCVYQKKRNAEDEF